MKRADQLRSTCNCNFKIHEKLFDAQIVEIDDDYVYMAKLEYILVCETCKSSPKVTVEHLHLFRNDISCVQLEIVDPKAHSLIDGDDSDS